MWGMLTQWRLGKNIGDDLTLVLGFVDKLVVSQLQGRQTTLYMLFSVRFLFAVSYLLLAVGVFLLPRRRPPLSILSSRRFILLKSEDVFTHSPFSIRNSVLPSSDQFLPSLVLSQLT